MTKISSVVGFVTDFITREQVEYQGIKIQCINRGDPGLRSHIKRDYDLSASRRIDRYPFWEFPAKLN